MGAMRRGTPSSAYRPSPKAAEWNHKIEHEQIARDIKQSLFSGGLDAGQFQQVPSEFDRLAQAAEQLEISSGHIALPMGGRHHDRTEELQRGVPVGREEGDGSSGPNGLGGSVRLTHEEIHAHSWRPCGPSWLWISKASAVAGTGYPARPDEILRLGHRAKRVRRIPAPPPLQKSFVEAVRGAAMARQPPQQRLGKIQSGYEEWMDNDDLLGVDLQRERELRSRLYREEGSRHEEGYRHGREGEWREFRSHEQVGGPDRRGRGFQPRGGAAGAPSNPDRQLRSCSRWSQACQTDGGR
jgi:hypothetical protein